MYIYYLYVKLELCRKMVASLNCKRMGISLLQIFFPVFSLPTCILEILLLPANAFVFPHSLTLFSHKCMICFNNIFGTTKHLIRCFCTGKYLTPVKRYASNWSRQTVLCSWFCFHSWTFPVRKTFIYLTFFFLL